MHPVPAHEKDRIDCLHSLGILYTEPSDTFDRICELVACQFGTSAAFLSFVDTSTQWFKSTIGLDLSSTRRDVAFCAHTIMTDDVFVVEDAGADERFRLNPLVTDGPRIRFYAGAPLIYSPGLRLGSVCAVDHEPRRFSAQERRLLQSFAAIVVSELRLLAAGRLLRRSLAEEAGRTPPRMAPYAGRRQAAG
ncbi:GAF domain-containing protein [Alsobacter sp. R-9]